MAPCNDCINPTTGCGPTFVNETVCVEATVRIIPDVQCGVVETFCSGPPTIGSCDGTLMPECSFQVSQSICVQVPLTFSATACVTPNGIICNEDTIAIGRCPESAAGCTFSQGHFTTHPDLARVLVASSPGGVVVLGIDNQGLSFTVTPSNVESVFLNGVPTPPAPEDPPFANQYQQLYQQLLAANLNVLNGATCENVVNAINAANDFIANSPEGGMAGAPGFQSPLAEFNRGEMEGCPEHCPE